MEFILPYTECLSLRRVVILYKYLQLLYFINFCDRVDFFSKKVIYFFCLRDVLWMARFCCYYLFHRLSRVYAETVTFSISYGRILIDVDVCTVNGKQHTIVSASVANVELRQNLVHGNMHVRFFCLLEKKKR